MAFISVSTSVAKLMPLISTGSEVDLLHSVVYAVWLNRGFDCTGEALSDLTTCVPSRVYAERTSRTAGSEWESVGPA
jgi:hypothetical protein